MTGRVDRATVELLNAEARERFARIMAGLQSRWLARALSGQAPADALRVEAVVAAAEIDALQAWHVRALTAAAATGVDEQPAEH